MAIYRAKCWLGSSSGYQTLEVKSNTLSGAKEQFQRIYGAQQVINLHQVRESNNSSSSVESSSGGWLIGGLVLIGAIVTYWYYAIPAAIVIGVLWYFGTRE